MCPECIDGMDLVRAFFNKCFNANQELIIALRKSRPSPLDLNTHINQYQRSFNAPTVPQIKIEPYLDSLVQDQKNGYYENDWIVDESLDESESEEDSEDSESDDDLFKVPKLPKKSGKKGAGKNGFKSNRGRKRFVPLALKTCSLCGKEFSDHAGNLSHWKEAHPDQEVVYKCLENLNGQTCNFSSNESEDIFKHRSKHKIRDIAVEIKEESQIE